MIKAQKQPLSLAASLAQKIELSVAPMASLISRGAHHVRDVLDEVLLTFEREPRLTVTVGVLGFVCAYLLYLVARKPYDPKRQKQMSKQVRASPFAISFHSRSHFLQLEDELIAEWSPVPLCPSLPEALRKRRVPILERYCCNFEFVLATYLAIISQRYGCCYRRRWPQNAQLCQLQPPGPRKQQ